ncbi:MAG TPA: hydroxysqualene dehydroxylase HpnE [Vicinamibacteria bacterium]|nr:hydroxysqualene dehydroxylase HpnE [Vicinamibacteria bacterium]
MRVVVIGAGFAGLAAAIALQERRHHVLLLERRGVLGGRATSYRDAVSGDDVDNGTHLMVGAYTQALDLIRRAGAADLLRAQEDLRIDYADERGLTTLACPRLPAPLHLLAGLLRLRLPWRVRWQALRLALAIRWGGPPRDITLAEYFRRTGQGDQARRLLWDPLATAILNETPERAAAVLFYNVYREAFLESRRGSALVFLRRGYGQVHERLAAYFTARGGDLRRRALAQEITVEDGAARAVRYLQRAADRPSIREGIPPRIVTVEADAVVAAVPWHAVPPLLPEPLRAEPPFAHLGALPGSPIVSVEMWVEPPVVPSVMVGLRDCEVQWVFDKGRLFGRTGPSQHLAFIVSAAYRTAPRSNTEIAAAAEAALRRFFPAMANAAVKRTLVIREANATFASDPASEALRPGARTPVRRLFLAGDWTDTALPATIEGAVRSGRRAARCAEEVSAG